MMRLLAAAAAEAPDSAPMEYTIRSAANRRSHMYEHVHGAMNPPSPVY
jgi:hypothetical protein